jgi:DNA-binding NarL/FixJ family response regulator
VRDPSIAGRLHDETVAGIDRFLRGVTADDTSPHTPSGAGGDRSAPNGLTPRELQILRQVAAGSTNKEIARKFGLAVSTVVRHLVNLYTKIGARGRAMPSPLHCIIACRRGPPWQYGLLQGFPLRRH